MRWSILLREGVLVETGYEDTWGAELIGIKMGCKSTSKTKFFILDGWGDYS